jgi:translation elongation factor EF-4
MVSPVELENWTLQSFYCRLGDLWLSTLHTTKLVFGQMDMLTPKEYIGPLMELAKERRGIFKEMKFITDNRTSLLYDLPMGEVRY